LEETAFSKLFELEDYLVCFCAQREESVSLKMISNEDLEKYYEV